jgi:ethanolamine ammonia-lyase large subunit
MQRRLAALGVIDAGGQPRPGPESIARLYATYQKNGADRRTRSALEDEARLRLRRLRERGFDLGGAAEADADARVDAIYANARAALYARIEETVLREACPRRVEVTSSALDRDDYLAHPTAGERLAADAAPALAALAAPATAAGERAPYVQIVISDGLNANALNEQLRDLLPPLRRALSSAGCRVGGTEVVVRNGRVRAGYEAGGLTGADVIVHVIGERPGTGLNTLSAYLTWGRDESGCHRWDRGLDHAATTAICGIHPRGKPPLTAAAEIARTVMRMVEQRRSGVALGG